MLCRVEDRAKRWILCARLSRARAARAVLLACVTGALTCIATVWPTSRAAACGACVCLDEAPEAWVAGGFSGVPRNPRLLVSSVLASRGVLRTALGDVVSFTSEPAGRDGVVWVRPTTLLEKGESYTLRDESSADVGGGAVTFVVTADTDETPPATRAARVRTAVGGAECNLAVAAVLKVGEVHDSGRKYGSVIYAQLDIESPAGRDRVFLPARVATQEQELNFGLGRALDPTACLGTRLARHAQSESDTIAEITFYDLAGNTLAAGDQTFRFGEVTTGTCPGPALPASSPEVQSDGDHEADAGEADAANDPASDAGGRPSTLVRPGSGGCSVRMADAPHVWTQVALVFGCMLVLRSRGARRPSRTRRK